MILPLSRISRACCVPYLIDLFGLLGTSAPSAFPALSASTASLALRHSGIFGLNNIKPYKPVKPSMPLSILLPYLLCLSAFRPEYNKAAQAGIRRSSRWISPLPGYFGFCGHIPGKVQGEFNIGIKAFLSF